MSKIKTPVETIRVRTVGSPAPFVVDSELEGVRPSNQAEVVGSIEPRVALVIRKARFGVEVRPVGHEIEERLGHDVVGVRRRVELTDREAQVRTIDGVEVVGWRAPEQVGCRTLFLLADHANVEFIHHGWADDTGPGKQDRVGRLLVVVFENGKVFSVTENPAAVSASIHPPASTAQGESILARRMIVEFERLEKAGNFAVVLPFIVVRQSRVIQVWQRHEIEQELPLLVDAIVTNGVALERLMRRGVRYGDALSGARSWEDGLREIARPLRRRGDRHPIPSPGLLDLPVFLRIEEEQLLFVGVEPVRNISRTSHREAKSAKPIDGLGQAIAVVKEVVGVQLFMPLVFVHRAVKVFGAGLGD